MAIYERSIGGHVAEREQPEPGSPRAEVLAKLADDPASDWRVAEDDKPKRRRAPAKKKDDDGEPDGSDSEGSESGDGESGGK